MHRLFFLTVFFVFSSFPIYGEAHPDKFEGNFEGWEQKRLDLISLFLPPNPVILQAGGHYGDEAIIFALLWPNSTVISFEPNPHAFSLFTSKTSRFPHIHGYNLALHERNERAILYVCHGTCGKDPKFEHASSLLKPTQEMAIHYEGPQIKVKGVILDDWCKKNGVKHVDFMRLDVQGSELQVLKHCPKILRTVKVLYVNTNFFAFRVGTTLHQDLKKFLDDSGFTLLAHWYKEGLEGSAIFINNNFYH